MQLKLVAINVINLMIILKIKRMDSADKTVLSHYRQTCYYYFN